VTERALVPADRCSLVTLGVVAAARREVEVSSGALTGGGERITVGWRFWPGRPRVSAALLAPAPWGGLWGVDAFTERQPFTSEAIPTSRRQGAHLSMSEWLSARVRASLRGGVEHWGTFDTFGMLGAGLRVLTVGERLDGRINASGWKGESSSSFGTIDAGATLRSTTQRRGHVFVGRAGLGLASMETPADIWFAGDTGRARDVPLRAHPLISHGEMRVEQIGRRVTYTSAEMQQWWAGKTPVRFGAATFLDVARVDLRTEPRARTDVDVGIGARLAVPGVSGVFRVDVAKGLRDGATAVSFVYDP
jgi:hypothetical protein